VAQDEIDVVRRLEAAYDSGEYDKLGELLSPQLQSHTPGSDQIPQNAEGITMASQMSKQAFPDRKVTIEDIFAEGDLVVVRERMTGTNKGGLPWFGIPANDREIDVEYIQILRVEDGKVAESWANMDFPKMMMQLGAMPGPEGGAA
jgi:predicted ester cyclase